MNAITRYWPDKDPTEALDFDITWLLPTGDTVSTATWTVEEGDAALVLGAHVEETDKTITNISGGTAGVRYKVNCHITTTLSNQFDRACYLRVRAL